MAEEPNNNSWNLAIACGSHGPASTIVRDGHLAGTLFTWVGRWIVYDLENKKHLGERDRLAVVTVKQQEPDKKEIKANDGVAMIVLDDDATGHRQPEHDLNICSIACDMEAKEWVIDADRLLPLLRQIYGEALAVLWEQGQIQSLEGFDGIVSYVRR